MKSRKEIEERIGFSLEYDEWTEYIKPNDWNNFMGEAVKHRELNQKTKEAVENLLVESLKIGDMETASICGEILEEATLDNQEREEFQDIENGRIEQIIADIDSLDENASIENIEEKLENIRLSKNACSHIDDETKKRIEDKRKELTTILQQKVKDKISSLDEQIAELQEHIEIPENEDKLKELQEQVESLEEKYYEDSFKDSHKAKRIAEQGIDMSEIMQSISEYRIYDWSYIHKNNFNELNGKIANKTEFLEKKLAFLQKYKDIPGNVERIAELESQIETMQDSWIVAQEGYNNMDEILQTAESRKNKIQARLVQAQKEIETITPMSRAYLQKRNEIENFTKEVTKYERYIKKMQQTKAEIESGENTSFMGKHHRDRLQREEQERVESNRGRIQELDEQIAELQEHIEIPENEQKIINLQAQIDEIEATIPSDRGNHKRARLQEQGRDTKTIMKDIDDIIAEFNDPYVGSTAKIIDAEIKTRVAYLENKMNHLQEHLDIVGNKERVEEIQSQIEQLEDKWELCTQGFGSKEQVEQRIRVKKAHLYTTLTSFKGNKELELSAEQMQEYWERIQNGEKVPELFGQHHRERLERKKNTRIKAEQETKERAEEQARIETKQEAKAKTEKQARIKTEQEEKERQESIDKDIAEYEQYDELIAKKPELDILYNDLFYEDFSSQVNDSFTENMRNLMKRLETLPNEERKVLLCRYNKNANYQINEQCEFADEEVRKKAEQEAKARAETKKAEIEQLETVIEEQPELQTTPEQVEVETIKDEPSVSEETIGEKATGTRIEIDSASMMEAHLEYMRNHQTQQTSQVVEDYWNEIHSQQAKVYEQQQPEKIRPREKSIKDEVGDELKTTEKQLQERKNPTVDLWMNRFNGWYSAIDRVSQNVKARFVKMKSDIIKAISEKLKEKTNYRQANTQEQDTNER